ncbi:MAG: FlgO family outer membrane protein [Alphaproteobacteria bacterium]
MTGYFRYLFILSIAPFLVSCGETIAFKAVTAGISAASHGVFSRPDVNLKEKNYAAADFLAVKIKDKVGRGDIIIAKQLEEMDHAGISSPLGAFIPEGVGLRLAELGYNVQLHEVAMNGNSGLYSLPSGSASANFVLRGTYLPNNKDVDVFLRVIDVKSGSVVASFDYSLLLSREVRELSKTQTKIFRVSK